MHEAQKGSRREHVEKKGWESLPSRREDYLGIQPFGAVSSHVLCVHALSASLLGASQPILDFRLTEAVSRAVAQNRGQCRGIQGLGVRVRDINATPFSFLTWIWTKTQQDTQPKQTRRDASPSKRRAGQANRGLILDLFESRRAGVST